jgi:pilus assembly protein CpaB
MRAVAIPVKANTMAGGFISPGDYVDVILTYRVRGGSNEDTRTLVNQMASETILKNVKVLAVDQEAKRDDDTAKIARTVTLQVDTAGAEKVALGSEMGDIILSLRGLGDDKVEGTSSYTTDVLTNKVLQDVAAIQGGGATGRVKIYSGSTLIEQRAGGGGATMDSGYDDSAAEAEQVSEELTGAIEAVTEAVTGGEE